jgi:acyl-CoA thioesterase I
MKSGYFPRIAASLLLVFFWLHTNANAQTDTPPANSPHPLLEPIWRGSIVHGESAVLFQETEGGPYLVRLAFPIHKLISVRTSNREIDIPLDQIEIEAAGKQLSISQSLKLNGLLRDSIYLPANSPLGYRHRLDHPDQWMLYGPGRWFHDRQIEVTYERKKYEWTNAAPAFAAKLLPKTIAKLKGGKSVTIGVSGDSITTGLDSSGSAKVAPNQPGYVELVAHELRLRTTAKITVENRAVAGWSVSAGLNDLGKLLEGKPDLILIAYGMNDVGRRDPDWYGKTIDQMLAQIAASLPEAEVILVSTMVGNAEWVHTPREMFAPYRNQLAQRVREGVALADVTSLWLELLKNKHDLDLTGNGLNHPNDFGHRIYAQAVLALLTE